MPSFFAETMMLFVGLVAGYFGAYYRSRRDMLMLERQIDCHFKLAQQQYKLQIDQIDQGQRRVKVQEAYDQLGRWLHRLERTIDEVWFGCASQDKDVEQNARRIVEQWPWETLKLPAEFYSAGFYWSGDVRELIRKFERASVGFTTEAMLALNSKHKVGEQEAVHSETSRVWHCRSELLSIIDDIRATARADLAPQED